MFRLTWAVHNDKDIEGFYVVPEFRVNC